MPLAVDQREPNASPPPPPPAAVDGFEADFPNDTVFVGAACLEVMPGKLWLGEMVLEKGDLADEVGLFMVD